MSESIVSVTRIRYSPNDFNIGDHVRLYLAWATNQDIFIREGIVLNPRKNKSTAFGTDESLEIRVKKTGILERRDPRDTAVINCDGYVVSGYPKVEPVNSEYTQSYFFHCITRVDSLPRSD